MRNSVSLLVPCLLALAQQAVSTTTPTTALATRYENLVLEGGGLKGISYVGAMKSFRDLGYYDVERGYRFVNISGTSIGCLFGFAVALDIDPSLLEDLVLRTDFHTLFHRNLQKLLKMPKVSNEYYIQSFNYVKYSYDMLKYFSRVVRMWMNHKSPGISGGQNVVTWLLTEVLPLSRYADLLGPTSTMRDLRSVTGHDLTCFATRLVNPSIVRFSATETPEQNVFDAIYASISLPMVFKPLQDQQGRPLVDGGLLNNFPIYEYDHEGIRSESTLGLSLHRALSLGRDREGVATLSTAHREGSRYKRMSSISYLRSLLSAIVGARSYLTYASDARNCDRIVYLASPLRLLDFKASRESKRQAIVSAAFETRRFFAARSTTRCPAQLP